MAHAASVTQAHQGITDGTRKTLGVSSPCLLDCLCSDQMALKPSLDKRPSESKSGGNGRAISKEPAESTRVSKTEDKKLIFIAGDSIVQHVYGCTELSNAKQRVAVKSFSVKQEIWPIT